MPTEVATLCFHTRDAVARDDSSLTFEMPSNRLRTAAAKVALASCEFPMVQHTIEPDWNRLWLNEGVRLAPDACVLDVVVRHPGEPEPQAPVRLRLPPRLNRAACAWKGGRLVVECAAPHGLFSEHTRQPLRAAMQEARVLGGAGGDVALGVALAEGKLEYLSFYTYGPQNVSGYSPIHGTPYFCPGAQGNETGVNLLIPGNDLGKIDRIFRTHGVPSLYTPSGWYRCDNATAPLLEDWKLQLAQQAALIRPFARNKTIH